MTCPGCGQIDLVRRIAAIWRDEQTRVQGPGVQYGAALDGRRVVPFAVQGPGDVLVQSVLSQHFAPPPPPRRWEEPISDAIMLVTLLAGVPGIGVVVGLAGLTALVGATQTTDGTDLTQITWQVVLAVVSLTLASALLLAGALLWRSRLRARWRKHPRVQNARRTWEEGMVAWQERYNVWEALCYCGRCGGVFLPGRERLVPPESIALLATARLVLQ